MFCEKCGTKNDSSSKFCEKCGAKIESEVKKSGINTAELKNKFNSLTKKQKIVGSCVIGIAILLIVTYIVGSKLTSLDNIGSKAFEQLASEGKISNKYSSVDMNDKNQYLTFEKSMKKIIKDKKIKFDYTEYEVKSSNKSIVVKYYDNTDDKTYRVIFSVRKSGKSMLVFDKYVIDKVSLAKSKYSKITLFDASKIEKIKISVPKNAKVKIGKKELTKGQINKKKSDDDNTVYNLDGIIDGESYDFEITIGDIVFEKSLYVYGNKDVYNLAGYISSSNVKNEKSLEKTSKNAKKYLETYYEYVGNDKSYKDFKKKYKGSDEIEKIYDKSKENFEKIDEFKIDKVTYKSFYSYKNQVKFTYKVDYSVKANESDSVRETYSTISITYNLSDLNNPVDLSYLPY